MKDYARVSDNLAGVVPQVNRWFIGFLKSTTLVLSLPYFLVYSGQNMVITGRVKRDKNPHCKNVYEFLIVVLL